jgi:hypothetical protein
MSCGSRRRRRGLVRRWIQSVALAQSKSFPLALAVTLARDTGPGRDRRTAGRKLLQSESEYAGYQQRGDMDQRRRRRAPDRGQRRIVRYRQHRARRYEPRHDGCSRRCPLSLFDSPVHGWRRQCDQRQYAALYRAVLLRRRRELEKFENSRNGELKRSN